ncbi:MAG: hypothetical protein F6K54_26650 [Okeania sp. SIO3B5]|uniref:hypothetical protein n=1 Tax=Okeania sp. SIO3B5 TaxID=2607811 RepID=UPI0014005943|nr:hypothetical protein [Okeania sp. SIO3B5]NEO56348.1 hypothetical protein [Okeania sp. SIO3B5]
MANILDLETSSLEPKFTDSVMTVINGLGLGNEFPTATEFGAENSYINIEELTPTVEDFSIVYSPTTSELIDSPTGEEIDILTGNSVSEEETATRQASATNPNAEEVHRFWDQETQSHFFTADEEEFEDSLAN